MTTRLDIDRIRDNNGMLPTFAWPGGYPLFYATRDGEALCPVCANGGNGSIAVIDGTDDSAADEWTIVGYDVNWESPAMYCAHCYARIPSAYAPQDTDQ